MAFLQPRDRGNGAETNTLRLRLVLNQLTPLCDAVVSLHIFWLVQIKAKNTGSETRSRQKLGVQNLESFGHELELTIPDHQKQMKWITAWLFVYEY